LSMNAMPILELEGNERRSDRVFQKNRELFQRQ
jgi:hypothetical protein